MEIKTTHLLLDYPTIFRSSVKLAPDCVLRDFFGVFVLQNLGKQKSLDILARKNISLVSGY